jgi:hypothetical protein
MDVMPHTKFDPDISLEGVSSAMDLLNVHDSSWEWDVDDQLEFRLSTSYSTSITTLAAANSRNFTNNLLSIDSDSSPREHPLYQNATIGLDGLYHCPWEEDSSCNHKPEKLKCNYE